MAQPPRGQRRRRGLRSADPRPDPSWAKGGWLESDVMPRVRRRAGREPSGTRATSDSAPPGRSRTDPTPRATDGGMLALWRTARVLKIAPINNEMILNYIAQYGMGLPRSY